MEPFTTLEMEQYEELQPIISRIHISLIAAHLTVSEALTVLKFVEKRIRDFVASTELSDPNEQGG